MSQPTRSDCPKTPDPQAHEAECRAPNSPVGRWIPEFVTPKRWSHDEDLARACAHAITLQYDLKGWPSTQLF